MLQDDISTEPKNVVQTTDEPPEQDVFVFPVSFAQERLWLLEQFRGKESTYNTAGALHLTGNLQINALQKALNEIVQRHEILRTTFAIVEGSLCQVIVPVLSIPLEVIDLQAILEEQQLAEVQRLAKQEIQESFDLVKGPLMHLKLFKLGTQSYVLLVTMHHIICDGWSIGVLIQELSTLYDTFCLGLPSPLAELPIQYADFAEWQQEWLSGERLETKLNYWRDILADAPPMITLPTDHPRPSVQTFQWSTRSIILPQSLTTSLQTLSRSQGVTLFTTLLVGLKLLLTKWTGQSDLVVGTVIAGRNRAEIEPLIGCFMNFLALRSQISNEQTVNELFKQVGKTVLEAYAHQDCPFEKVVEAINPNRQANHNPIYNIAFLLQNFPLDLQFSQTIKAHPLTLETGSALLDLRFEAFESPTEILFKCEYNTDLFEVETIDGLLQNYSNFLEKLVQNSEAKLYEFELSEEFKTRTQRLKTIKDKPTLAISSTFTAEPIEEFLEFWSKELNLPFEVKFAPYNQVFQELLNPTSVLNNNSEGINILLIRFEDWQKDINKMEQAVKEFITALNTACEQSQVKSYFVISCPPSPKIVTESANRNLYHQWEKGLEESLSGARGVYVIKSSELVSLYSLEDYYDPQSDELGHIPYNKTAFAALGTIIARKLHTLKRNPYKVIALDCDQTLWKGICGEDGAEGIEITPPYQALQKFVLAQQQQGKLLCLCSKNDEQDVFAVFDYHSSMPLKREHIVSHRINWQPKSENLKLLAQELNLGLDSFIFVDDNPLELAEVQANCPEVLAVQLPEEVSQIPQFLEHFWAFDHLNTTEADRSRTQLYRENIKREHLRQSSLTFQDFLAELDLEVDIQPIIPSQSTRISQLTQRTNQFNFTTIRRTEAEIQQLCQSGKLDCLTVKVKDRFGDYGLVGVMLFEQTEATIKIDTFLLSCRALGRGVEHQMLAKLGTIAQQKELSWLEISCLPTAKNRPAQDFLNQIGSEYRQKIEQGWLFRLPAAMIAQLNFKPNTKAEMTGKNTASQKGTSDEILSTAFQSELYQRIACELKEPEQIIELVESRKQWQQRAVKSEFVSPRNSVEEQIADIWQDILKVKQVGIYDNFFALGGSSLLGVQVINRVRESFNVDLPLINLFEQPTVVGIAECIEKVGCLASISAPISSDLENREEIEL